MRNTAATKSVTDELETLIIMALDANHSHKRSVTVLGNKKSHCSLEKRDQGELLNFQDMKPKSAYTFNPAIDDGDGGRILTSDPGLLLSHPAEIIGEEAEVIMLSDDRMKWCGFRQLSAKPKKVACIGKATHWYEFHLRIVHFNGLGIYVKRLVPLTKSGEPIIAKIESHVICSPRFEGFDLVMCASAIEDAKRPGTMLASVSDATEIKFAVPIADYKEMFASRDGPFSGERRRAIIHWVASHIRLSIKKNEHEVKKHTRGIQEFEIDGLKIRIEPNDK